MISARALVLLAFVVAASAFRSMTPARMGSSIQMSAANKVSDEKPLQTVKY